MSCGETERNMHKTWGTNRITIQILFMSLIITVISIQKEL